MINTLCAMVIMMTMFVMEEAGQYFVDKMLEMVLEQSRASVL